MSISAYFFIFSNVINDISNFEKMEEDLTKELKFRTSKSSGAGGQHVNKVETKVELLFDLVASQVLTELQKEIIYAKLGNRISREGLLILQCDESRSQARNKEIAIARLMTLIEKALKPQKKRKKTKPSKSKMEKRLLEKKRLSEKKESRKFQIDD
jgi:ribosome-associated protein